MDNAPHIAAPQAQTSVSEATPGISSLIELSDDEIVSWLSASILDEFERNAAGSEPISQNDFWEQVAATESQLVALGYNSNHALQQAIALLGVGASLADPAATVTEAASAPLRGDSWSPSGALESASLGQQQLVALHSELVERAQRAVAVWSSLQGSALRSASNARG
jgi:hypothetical protein